MQDLCLLVIDLESRGTCSLAEFLCLLLYVVLETVLSFFFQKARIFFSVAGLTLSDVVIFRDDVPPSQQRITMDGLEPNTLYRAYVAGKTKGGRGERYFIDVRTTDEKSGTFFTAAARNIVVGEAVYVKEI